MNDNPEPKLVRSRRDVLRVATGAAGAVTVIGAVGGAALLVPRLERQQPGPSELLKVDVVEIDLAPIAPGQQILIYWGSWPVFIVRRTAAALALLQHADLREQLSDPDSKERQQPPYAGNWGRSVKPDIAVLVGVCTHMGCLPQFHPEPSVSDPEPGWLGGYLCACHGSKYDLAGRVFKGVPAPYNLPVPPYCFVNDHTIRIGENPAGERFDFNSILQI